MLPSIHPCVDKNAVPHHHCFIHGDSGILHFAIHVARAVDVAVAREVVAQRDVNRVVVMRAVFLPVGLTPRDGHFPPTRKRFPRIRLGPFYDSYFLIRFHSHEACDLTTGPVDLQRVEAGCCSQAECCDLLRLGKVAGPGPDAPLHALVADHGDNA